MHIGVLLLLLPPAARLLLLVLLLLAVLVRPAGPQAAEFDVLPLLPLDLLLLFAAAVRSCCARRLIAEARIVVTLTNYLLLAEGWLAAGRESSCWEKQSAGDLVREK